MKVLSFLRYFTTNNHRGISAVYMCCIRRNIRPTHSSWPNLMIWTLDSRTDSHKMPSRGRLCVSQNHDAHQMRCMQSISYTLMRRGLQYKSVKIACFSKNGKTWVIPIFWENCSAPAVVSMEI